MSNEQFYHALKVDEETCFGCTHCMNACPTQAVRIKDGVAVIQSEKCVDCGACLRVCPVDAIYIEQDDFEQIFKYNIRVAVLPSVFIGQFSRQHTAEEIIDVVKGLGFTHVVPGEAVVDVINEEMLAEYKTDREKPLISSFCPAIVSLIQLRFPALAQNIIPLKHPAEATALYYKQLLLESGTSADQIGMFYVTPCAAKISALRSTDKETVVDGIINMNFLYNKVYHVLNSKSEPNRNSEVVLPYYTPKVMEWSLTQGESKHMEGRCLAIDEIHNVISFLERVENEEVMNVDFLELRACDQSCAGGALMSENRFLTVERVHTRANRIQKSGLKVEEVKQNHLEYVREHLKIGEVEPRQTMALDQDMGKALKKMERVRSMMCFLPGVDCGVCGAPNCQSLAEDIVMKKAHLSDCGFLQRMMEKTKKLDPDHSIRIMEKIWGKDRLDKDCKKKGAKYEGL